MLLLTHGDLLPQDRPMHRGYSVFKCDGKKDHPDDLEVLALREEKNGRAYSEPLGLVGAGFPIFLLCPHSSLVSAPITSGSPSLLSPALT